MPEFKRIQDFTFAALPPKDWDEAKNGPCASVFMRLEQHEHGPMMAYALEFLPDELELLKAGEPLIFRIAGSHPLLMSLEFGDHSYTAWKESQK